jgi:hypothetical protein
MLPEKAAHFRGLLNPGSRLPVPLDKAMVK